MTTRKSPSNTKPPAANKTRNRENQSRDSRKPSDETSQDEPEADIEGDTDSVESTENDESDSERSAAVGSSEGDDANSGKPSASSSLITQLLSSLVGDNLKDAIAAIKSKVSEQMEVHGAEYLDSAKTHLIEATEKVVAWGKKHPVQAAAAATALIGVSAFLYATLRDKNDRETQKQSAKGQD